MIYVGKRKNEIQEKHIVEGILRQIWVMEEDDDNVSKETLYKKFSTEHVDHALDEMTAGKLIHVDGPIFELTKIGRDRARLILRRHRIAERLLHDVLGVSDEVFELGACQFEHFVNEEIVSSICTLLGHPITCPHGKKIPPGSCCLHAKRKLQPVLGPLTKLRSGVQADVAYIAARSEESIERLSAIGVVPGLRFTVHHREPTFVIQFGERQLALDKEIAEEIFVRVITG
ncbi:MAG: DtxR family transcriptional regulator [Candidatus Scalindua sp. AMX11]|nr:MAG: DtxR family transcriptional regulator [Candidatus Scalindua sp.]NOG84859.1 metal-dependent transcriptional regulator [Planctomycetota bacterium]RZV84929.1 MAG: DtxR family transcriptional regulator [Candidatus Scalindua sp. SCAELEC01]TDE65079.1 MAG: DtxR family transcriptional regulator [Candidatus Scalindua sp. AMX11]GJQ59472.1 MAG: iron-dependent repressor [Candidatus Scalindua sp.]